jgi:hypothetical protein
VKLANLLAEGGNFIVCFHVGGRIGIDAGRDKCWWWAIDVGAWWGLWNVGLDVVFVKQDGWMETKEVFKRRVRAEGEGVEPWKKQ